MHLSYKIRITVLITAWQLNSLNCADQAFVAADQVTKK